MKRNLLLAALAAAVLSGCSKDNGPGVPPPADPETVGYYILCEGDWGVGNASIAWYDLETKTLTKDYFAARNDGAALGGTASDLKIYGAKMYCTVLEDNKVVVMNAADAKVIKTIAVDGARSLACDDGKVYVSSYTGAVMRIDTASLNVTGTAAVTGKYCEGIAVLGDYIYVANNAVTETGQGFGNTVSVVNKATFAEVAQVETPVNPTRLTAGNDGYLYLVTSGDWFTVDGELHRIDPETRKIVYTFPELALTNLAILGDKSYTYHYSWIAFEASVKKIDLGNDRVTTFIASEPDFYSVSTDADNDKIFYTTAAGEAICYSPDGQAEYTLTDVGINPIQVVAWITGK